MTREHSRQPAATVRSVRRWMMKQYRSIGYAFLEVKSARLSKFRLVGDSGSS
jgi:hypothetical protein